ncbi:MAG: ATP-binding protein [Pseudomonadota bacterium]
MTEPFGDIRLSCLSSEYGVRSLLTRLMPMLPDWGIPDETAMTLEIVLAETLNNVAEHAFSDTDDAFIAVHIVTKDEAICVAVHDQGKPMPGLSLPDGMLPDADVERSELPEGGFGWFLIRSQTEALEYRRDAAGNHLSYRIPLSTNVQPSGDCCVNFPANNGL